MKSTLRTILLTHIQSIQGWIPKGSLYSVGEEEGYSPEYVGRELRTLAEEGKIQVDYYKSKRNIELARYSRLGEDIPKVKVPKFVEIEENGRRFMKMINA